MRRFLCFALACWINLWGANGSRGKNDVSRWSYERAPSPVKNDPRVLPDCSVLFYRGPQCIDSPNGYRCKCASGFAWNTRACVAKATESSFLFNQTLARNEARVVIDPVAKPFPDLTEMTIVAWVRLEKSASCGTLISYRVAYRQQDTLPFRIMICPTRIFVEMFDNRTQIQYKTNTNLTWNWFHLGFVWRRMNASIYINGNLAHARTFIPRRNGDTMDTIRGNGELMLGQTWSTAKIGANEVTVQNFDLHDDPRQAFKKPVTTTEILALTNGTSKNTEFLPEYGFNGEIAMLNIWNYTGRDLDMSDIYNDCTFMHCGKVIEWVDWRNGTFNLTMRWPSGIQSLNGKCFSQADLDSTCDKYCSAHNGTKCVLQVVNNIVWPRVPINSIVETVCPASRYMDSSQSNMTIRACDLVPGQNYVARWAAPSSDACLSIEHSDLRHSIRELKETVRSSSLTIAVDQVSTMFSRLSNLSAQFVYRSPVDVEAFLDSLSDLIVTQNNILTRLFADLDAVFPSRHEPRSEPRMTFNVTSAMFNRVMTSVNNLLHSRNDAAWNTTRPPGSEGVRLMRVLEDFYSLIARTLIFHIKTGNPTSREMLLTFAYDHVICKARSYTDREFHGVTFPDKVDDQALNPKGKKAIEAAKAAASASAASGAGGSGGGAGAGAGVGATGASQSGSGEEEPQTGKSSVSYTQEEAEESLEMATQWTTVSGTSMSTRGNIELPKTALSFLNRTDKISNYIIVTCSYPKMFNILPNHNWYTKLQRVQMEDNLNSVVYHIKAYVAYDTVPVTVSEVQTLAAYEPLKAYLFFKNTSNISNPECVNLPLDSPRSSEHYVGRWTNRYCKMISNDSTHAYCGCRQLGLVAVTTDMYDDSWREPIVWPVYVTVPSYIGCCVSILSCFSAFVMLVYLKTSTKTASIHKNFALAIAFGQLAFMIGVERYNYETVCMIFAILLHYFFLCTFAWLMNEALNLYIVITYAAHSHGAEHAESASFWRYYVFGWILPAIVVGATYGSNQNTYLPNTGRVIDKVCWINWDLKWFFVGPAVGIISIATVVLVFTAKEHHESSYTKDEKSNRAIIIHSKALWTQAILLTMSWSFAILTLKMKSYILTLLFAMFNFLQGIFFLVFYFLLNSEVQHIYASQSFKGATTMLLGGVGVGLGVDSQAGGDGNQSGGLTLRNANAQMSSANVTRKLTNAGIGSNAGAGAGIGVGVGSDQQKQSGMLGRLKQLTALGSTSKLASTNVRKVADNDGFECRSNRRPSGLTASRQDEMADEPLLFQSQAESTAMQNAAMSMSEAPQDSDGADIPLANPASVAMLRDQILSPTTSWNADLLVTSV